MRDRREHLPSPVKQRILWSSPLVGMERPVRSFKSFIQTVPPNPGLNSQKPLPPIPTPTSPETYIPSPVIEAPLPKRVTIVAPWNAPNEWDWDVPSPITEMMSTMTARQYLPLLPEPSPVSPDMPGDVFTGRIEMNGFQRTPSDQEWGTMEDRPEPPPRNPSRLSMYGRHSGLNGSISSTTSILRDNQSSLSPSLRSETYSDQSTTRRSYIGRHALADPSYRLSDESTKSKSFASLGIGSTENSCGVGDAQADESVHRYLVLRGKNFSPFIRGDLLVPDETEEPGLDDQSQQLSYSQDYHNVLASQYHERDPQRAEGSIHPLPLPTIPSNYTGIEPGTSKRDQEMMPQPLAWGKSSDSFFSSRNPLKRRPNAGKSHVSRPSKMHTKLASWIPLPPMHSGARRASIVEDGPSNSNGDDGTRRPHLIRGVLGHTLLKKPDGFPKLLDHTKGVKSHGVSSKSGGLTEISHMPAQSLQPSMPPAKLRHYGTPQSNIRQLPPAIDTQRRGSRTGSQFPLSTGFRRPSSSYSQPSTTSPVSPAMAMGRKWRDSVYSLPFARPHSSNSSLSTSPLAQEVFFPHSPTPVLLGNHTRAHMVPLPVSRSPTSSKKDQVEINLGDETTDKGQHRPGFLDKARGVRDAWKKHHKEAKHEKLKQSIKLVGPMDAAIVDQYSKREGRVLVESDLQRRIPGYIVSQPF